MNISFNRLFKISMTVLYALLILALLYWGFKTCPPVPVVESTIRHDTTYITAAPVAIQVPRPQPRKIRETKSEELTIIVEDADSSPYTQGYRDGLLSVAERIKHCSDTVYYTDTFTSTDKWKLILSETLSGNRIINRSPLVQDLRPVVTTTVTTAAAAPKQRLRFYIGANVSLATVPTGNWGIGPAGLLAFPRGYAAQYGYDVRNRTHTIGAYALVQWNK